MTYAGGWILAGVLFLVVVRATYEFFSLVVRAGYRPSLLAAGVVMALFLAGDRFSPNLLGPVLALSTLGTLIWQLLRPPEGHPTESCALTLGAALWLGWLGSHFVLLRDLSPPFGLGAGTEVKTTSVMYYGTKRAKDISATEQLSSAMDKSESYRGQVDPLAVDGSDTHSGDSGQDLHHILYRG